MASIHARMGVVLAVLCVVGVAVGLSVQPATAHLGTPFHLWRDHIKPAADDRYLQGTNVVVSPTFSLGPLGDITVTKLCPVGWHAVGGGVDFETADADVQVISNGPLVAGSNLFAAEPGRHPASRGWRVSAHNDGALDVDGVLGVVCAR